MACRGRVWIWKFPAYYTSDLCFGRGPCADASRRGPAGGRLESTGGRPYYAVHGLRLDFTNQVRSWIRRRSNSAKLGKMLDASSPDALVVLIAPSKSDRNATALPINSSARPTRCGIERLTDAGVRPPSRLQVAMPWRRYRARAGCCRFLRPNRYRERHLSILRSSKPPVSGAVLFAAADTRVADQLCHAEFPATVHQ